MSETRTKRELEAAKLEAEAKAIRRAEKAFWSEVEERLPEVKKRFCMSDKFDEICQTYNATSDEEKNSLYRHLVSDTQVNYYRRIHKPEEDHQTSFTV